MPQSFKGPRLPRPLHLGLLLLGLLTSASSCQVTSVNGSGSIAASGTVAAFGVAGLAAGGLVYCAVAFEDCFPDQEALAARAAAFQRAQASFTAGLRRDQAGDPTGLALICRSAREGYPVGQYVYGARLLTSEPGRRAEALAWLRRAAAQGHGPAAILLLREGGPPEGGSTEDAALPATASCGERDPDRALASEPAGQP